MLIFYKGKNLFNILPKEEAAAVWIKVWIFSCLHFYKNAIAVNGFTILIEPCSNDIYYSIGMQWSTEATAYWA